MQKENHPHALKREILWERLESLLEKVTSRGLPSLSDQEVEDIGKLYRAAATHLALLQSFGASVRQRQELNQLVSRVHSIIYGRPRKGRNLQAFLWSFLAFPETVRQTFRYHVLAAVLLLLGGFYGYFGARDDPEWVLELVLPGDDRTPYATREELQATLRLGRPVEDSAVSEGEDSSADADRVVLEPSEKTVFAAVLWRHNTEVALLSFFSGFLFGVPTVLLLLYNGIVLGVYSYTFQSHALGWEWWAWLLPHGITELLAIILMSGGGLFLGHKILSPGEKSRLDALREVRASILQLVLFAFPMLLIAAVIESFVRQSGLSDSGRYVFAGASVLIWGVFFGMARVPGKTRLQLEARRTLAERAVPLPVEEEISAFLKCRSV